MIFRVTFYKTILSHQHSNSGMEIVFYQQQVFQNFFFVAFTGMASPDKVSPITVNWQIPWWSFHLLNHPTLAVNKGSLPSFQFKLDGFSCLTGHDMEKQCINHINIASSMLSFLAFLVVIIFPRQSLVTILIQESSISLIFSPITNSENAYSILSSEI